MIARIFAARSTHGQYVAVGVLIRRGAMSTVRGNVDIRQTPL
jgi:hypothetical protein